LFAQAFRAEPKLVEDLNAGNRYNAACSAALASAAKGEDKPPLTDSEKAFWRKQALEWLKADLARRTDQAGARKSEVREQLLHWQRDPDLAGIRDAESIKMLTDEQKACRVFWAEVDQLLKELK
jgi:hypothetical protein